jgi:hypothetical protein
MSDSDLWVTGFFIIIFMLFGKKFLISYTICESPPPFFFWKNFYKLKQEEEEEEEEAWLSELFYRLLGYFPALTEWMNNEF